MTQRKLITPPQLRALRLVQKRQPIAIALRRSLLRLGLVELVDTRTPAQRRERSPFGQRLRVTWQGRFALGAAAAADELGRELRLSLRREAP